jgi:hypothetical protein
MTATPDTHPVLCDSHGGVHEATAQCVMAEEIPQLWNDTPIEPARYLEDSVRDFAGAPDLPF